jgi:hypothetical protein
MLESEFLCSTFSWIISNPKSTRKILQIQNYNFWALSQNQWLKRFEKLSIGQFRIFGPKQTARLQQWMIKLQSM